ncbi:DUF3575 domain-containing protein [Alistipes sp.]|uniref:DUF3575 domain-containing protein n=1 Tax=Alistipes sp. TaxID=1872444 RepID=UPI0025C34136|nr:DUF3575 domain-containing protein [Alistipes sp.]
MKKWITTALLSLLLLPAMAQERTDTTYSFRFVAGDDMFYIPWSGNGAELDRLLACIAENRTAITDGTVPVRVDGYCTSQATDDENLAMAKTRSNRVKSEMILRGGLTEACFTTKNHAAEGNFVTVRIVIPATPSEGELEAQRRAAEQAEAERLEAERLAAERAAEEARKAEAERLAASETETVPPVLEESRDEAPEGCAMGLALRANLLRWATLTPDLGLEWRIGSRWSVGVNGSWTSWSWNDKERRYALWEVAPEVRCYIGKERRGYLGVMFKTGEFNYKLSETGKQGDLMGGGITAGYRLRLNKALDLDFNLGLGYLNADFEKYEVIDGVRVRRGNETKDWWGPINAGVTLVWKLF